jgi:hypothetical protein
MSLEVPLTYDFKSQFDSYDSCNRESVPGQKTFINRFSSLRAPLLTSFSLRLNLWRSFSFVKKLGVKNSLLAPVPHGVRLARPPSIQTIQSRLEGPRPLLAAAARNSLVINHWRANFSI